VRGEGEEVEVFVYGTLRRGGSNDINVKFAGATFIAFGSVPGVLCDLGGYPGLWLDAAAAPVVGEVYRVSQRLLVELDVLEGYDPVLPDKGEYRRVRIEVTLAGGGKRDCLIYAMRAEVAGGKPVIASGDWIGNRLPRPPTR
jgi:gamma-glutamylcyclotransferase (GGCT)/AIG2-like uncharacterized protein YtfP